MTNFGTELVSKQNTRRAIPWCDGEYDVGCIPYDNSDAVRERNSTLLTQALEEQYRAGSYRGGNGVAGPMLYKIKFPAKEFWFGDRVDTPIRIGGAIEGAGGRAYAMTSGSYDVGANGGAMTRFTWADGTATSACMRLRGYGFEMSNIAIQGRPYTVDAGGGIGPASGTKSNVGIEVEGRTSPVATGGHLIDHCLIQDCTYGICCKAGYYNDAGTFVDDEAHADTGRVYDTFFWSTDSCFRSENQQALGWKFRDISLETWGGAGAIPMVVFDIVRGGHIRAWGVEILAQEVVLFKVTDYSPWNSSLEAYAVDRDRYANASSYLTLFKYAGAAVADSGYIWRVRSTGTFGDTASTYDESKLIEITNGATNWHFEDMLFDYRYLDTTDFTAVGHMYQPDAAWSG